MIAPADIADRCSAELRLDLAEAEAEKPRTWKAAALKQDRIAAITRELVDRGAF